MQRFPAITVPVTVTNDEFTNIPPARSTASFPETSQSVTSRVDGVTTEPPHQTPPPWPDGPTAWLSRIVHPESSTSAGPPSAKVEVR